VPGGTEGAPERPRVERPASVGDSEGEEGGRERPGELRRWPDVGRDNGDDTDDDDTSDDDDDDDDDDDQPSSNDNK